MHEVGAKLECEDSSSIKLLGGTSGIKIREDDAAAAVNVQYTSKQPAVAGEVEKQLSRVLIEEVAVKDAPTVPTAAAVAAAAAPPAASVPPALSAPPAAPTAAAAKVAGVSAKKTMNKDDNAPSAATVNPEVESSKPLTPTAVVIPPVPRMSARFRSDLRQLKRNGTMTDVFAYLQQINPASLNQLVKNDLDAEMLEGIVAALVEQTKA